MNFNSLPFDEFLVVVNARDANGSYIEPKPDVTARISQEIERRTGLMSRNLAGEKVENKEFWVVAQRGNFVPSTHIAVGRVCGLLKRKNAKSFEVTFHNTQDGRNWGDRALLAVRYERA